MTQPHGTNQFSQQNKGRTVNAYSGTGNQTVVLNPPPVSQPRFRPIFGWVLVGLLIVDVIVAVVMVATGGLDSGLWQSVSAFLFMLTVLAGLLWLRLTRVVFSGLLHAVVGLFKTMGRATQSLAQFLSTRK